MGVENPGWILLGTALRCCGAPDGARRDLEALLQAFQRLDAGAAGCELAVEPTEASAGFVLLDERGSRSLLGEPLGPHLEHRLINVAIERARDHYVLHAGAIESPKGTCLILGESGAGKTSLTLWLWANGLRLLTDDLCPISHGSLAPESFPRALHMDAEYSPLLTARIPPRPAVYPADYYPFPGRAGAALPIAGILVIERGLRPEGEIEPLSQAEAAHHLLKAVIKNPAFVFENALEDMVRLSRRCRSHRLRSSTPEGAGAKALEWLSAL